jgi:hypothetical protein
MKRHGQILMILVTVLWIACDRTPTQPTGLKAEVVKGPSVQLTWNQHPKAESYVVYRNGTRVATRTQEMMHEYTDTRAGYGQHLYQLTAIKSDKESKKSPAVSVTITRPDPPDGLFAINRDGGILLSWNRHAGALGYNIYRMPGLPDKPLNRAPITAQRYTDTDVEQNVQYTYQVTALSPLDAESEKSSEASSTIRATPPPTPTLARPEPTVSPPNPSSQPPTVPAVRTTERGARTSDDSSEFSRRSMSSSTRFTSYRLEWYNQYKDYGQADGLIINNSISDHFNIIGGGNHASSENRWLIASENRQLDQLFEGTDNFERIYTPDFQSIRSDADVLLLGEIDRQKIRLKIYLNRVEFLSAILSEEVNFQELPLIANQYVSLVKRYFPFSGVITGIENNRLSVTVHAGDQVEGGFSLDFKTYILVETNRPPRPIIELTDAELTHQTLSGTVNQMDDGIEGRWIFRVIPDKATITVGFKGGDGSPAFGLSVLVRRGDSEFKYYGPTEKPLQLNVRLGESLGIMVKSLDGIPEEMKAHPIKIRNTSEPPTSPYILIVEHPIIDAKTVEFEVFDR